ncbi:MAG: mannose-6-phosphate isomerase-like protein (cupin superfamily) [Gammaproteobacteria bacterium]|jgi:mannose-6-phosphate isomerase-like protein (cupin superfamily)
MKNQSNHFGDKRQIIDTNTAKFDIYDFGGSALKGVYQLDLTYDRKTGHGAYMIRMEPGTVTTKHIHSIREEYLIMEGDVVESDGTVLAPGDYVIYEPGTEHNSRTVGGCTLIGFDYPAPEQSSESC